MIEFPKLGSYEAAVDVLGWCHSDSGVDHRTRDALEAILAYVHAVDEKLDRIPEPARWWGVS